MLSNLYRYNGSMISIISDYILKRPMDLKGYAPLYGEYKGGKNQNDKEKQIEKIDSLKLEYFEKLILATKEDGVKMIVTVSPIYNHLDIEEYQPIIDLCQKHNIPFIDYSNTESIINNNSLWKESVHLNDNGATKFTFEHIVQDLKGILSK